MTYQHNGPHVMKNLILQAAFSLAPLRSFLFLALINSSSIKIFYFFLILTSLINSTMTETYQAEIDNLNRGQKDVYNFIVNKMSKNEQCLCHIGGRGGCGKFIAIHRVFSTTSCPVSSGTR